MHDPTTDGGHHEGVGEAGDGIRGPNIKLVVVMVEPSSFNGRAAIEGGNRRLSEEASEQITDGPTNGMGYEDLEEMF